MIRYLFAIISIIVPALALAGDVMSGQSTTFEAAADGGTEVFGSEGPVLLGIGLVMLALTTIQLISGAGSQRAAAKTLDEIESIISSREEK